jgi:lysophospholipase L1-like esterase
MATIALLALTILATLLPAACGGSHGHSGALLEDVNHDGKIVILAFGDSITRGVGDGPDPHDTPPAPAGYPSRLLNLLRRSLAANNPDYAIILEGTIDVLSGATSRAVNNIQSMIDSVFSAAAVPILGTITPICCDTESRHPRSVILSYNDQLRTGDSMVQFTWMSGQLSLFGSYVSRTA